MVENKQGIQTADLVKRELENDLYLLELLKEGLVNYSALSRMLFDKVKKKNSKATLESISVAAKRYVSRLDSVGVRTIVKDIISNSQLSTRDDVVHYTFGKDKKLFDSLLSVSKEIKSEDLFLMNQGSGEITVIVDKRNEDLVSGFDVLAVRKNLAIISINEAFKKGIDKSVNVPGVYSYFINQLSRRDVNIIEIVSTYSQLTLVFDNEDLLRAYSILRTGVEFFRKI